MSEVPDRIALLGVKMLSINAHKNDDFENSGGPYTVTLDVTEPTVQQKSGTEFALLTKLDFKISEIVNITIKLKSLHAAHDTSITPSDIKASFPRISRTLFAVASMHISNTLHAMGMPPIALSPAQMAGLAFGAEKSTS